jgi:hypothetical protein
MTTTAYTMDLSDYVSGLPDDVRSANYASHSFDYEDRCWNCDCRPWGSWALLPCGAGPKALPAHVAPHTNASRFYVGFAVHSALSASDR